MGANTPAAGAFTTLTATGDIYTNAWADYSATSTVVGWSSFVAKQVYIKKIGKTVFVQYSITGTSDSVTTTFTVPYTISMPANSITLGRTYDGTSRAAIIGITAGGTNVITLNKDIDGAAFANSGDKYCYGQFWYQSA